MAQSATALTRTQEEVQTREGKYLTFTLAGEEYGISILKVKEIIGMMPITPVPKTPDFIKGVINLRGKVIPIVDLRLRFGMEAVEYTEKTCIIVVEILQQNCLLFFGIVVDSVSDVLTIMQNDIQDTPSLGSIQNTAYILGMAKLDGKVKILLDIDQVLGSSHGETLAQINDKNDPDSGSSNN